MERWRQECRPSSGFTLIELLIVISIIIVLAALVLGTSGYVQKKGQRSRAEAEIAALSAALESYKADNGIYPHEPGVTDQLDARTAGNPNIYEDASFVLYQQLSGQNADGSEIAGAKSYFSFKPQMLYGARDSSGNINPVKGVRDPFGNYYGYSTAHQTQPDKGYNPTFDLWSTGGTETLSGGPPNQVLWIKNW